MQGPQLFREYWRRPVATAEAFDAQGFFLTGARWRVAAGGCWRPAVARSCAGLLAPAASHAAAPGPCAALLLCPCTGDTAVLEQGGYYRLLGRTSVDVIKHGGYKVGGA